MPNRFSCSGQKIFFPTKPSTSQLSKWDSDEKMDETPDDEGFLKRMINSEFMQIFERGRNTSNNLNRRKKINPFTSVCVEFFGKSNSFNIETIFNPASCLRVGVGTQWIRPRRVSFSDEEDEEMGEKDSEDEEDNDEPMQGTEDLELVKGFNTLFSIPGEKDSEEKEMLKRRNPDGEDDGGCKDAKRVFDEKDPEEFDYMETMKQKDSEDPEEKKTLKRKNEDEEECKEAKRRYMDLYLL